MPIDRLYDRLHASSSTINQLNEVHINLDGRMTPREAHDLAEHIAHVYGSRMAGLPQGEAAALDQHAVDWAATVRAQLEWAGGGPPSPCFRSWIRGGATFYGRSAAPSRALLICFTVNARRMMMPAPTFLQHLAPFDADVLMLRARDGHSYADGVPGHSTDFASTLAWLASVHAEHGAERLIVMGSSMGALPAIAAGLSLPAQRILAAGTVDFGTSELLPGAGVTCIEELLMRLSHARPSFPALTLVFADDVPRDAEAALRIATTLPCREVMPVPDATHNCLFPLVERGTFGPLLERSLFSDE